MGNFFTLAESDATYGYLSYFPKASTRQNRMKDKDFTYRCSFLPPFLLAVLLLSLAQAIKAEPAVISANITTQQINALSTNHND